MKALLCLMIAVVFACWPPIAREVSGATPTVAVFEIDFTDNGRQGNVSGARPDGPSRLDRRSDEHCREWVAARCSLAGDLAAVASEIGEQRLILNRNLYVRDVKAGELAKVMSSAPRSNSDESWMSDTRGVIENPVLVERQLGQH